MTAETVAERLQMPLYQICAGELGSSPGVLEDSLARIFRFAGRWRAILLIDEADVYMEQRTMQDLVRNNLVSIFLRNLEYCQSVIFLTTNRVQTFDDAIVSRIHLFIPYSDTSADSRRQIWAALLDKATTSHGPATVQSRELTGLTERKMNGRQVSVGEMMIVPS